VQTFAQTEYLLELARICSFNLRHGGNTHQLQLVMTLNLVTKGEKFLRKSVVIPVSMV
jgi:hypothetical protein